VKQKGPGGKANERRELSLNEALKESTWERKLSPANRGKWRMVTSAFARRGQKRV